MKEKNMSRSELKRAAVLDSAMLEFQAKGFKATSMDDIAKRAEVSKRTVYNHFASKEVLFSAIMLKMMNLLCSFDHVQYNAEQGLAEQLTLLAKYEIAQLQNESFIAMARVIIAEAIHSPELIQEALANFNEQESPLAAWFNAAIAGGVLTTEHPELAVMQFISVIKGFCFWPQIVQGEAFPDADKIALITETAVQMILKQYG
ncbi:TetR/AcrR family transcriptional regulator [Moritella sp. F3]|uniref:TetR/AcrR family transcriptional regulator n=1 Tax=Moritella sp. F3 TaxID=2718882 RepID=UPI0018E13525|nr:TetR/AcrR family transcriptional regulator [Moritella sp. F3]GIC76993.1 TetR family transcriptional regulator [Moritella sp. F1]GIC80176.1 TetR family transcriptional regulator [Moritella sp. F3]